jgi:AAA+ ATPase superfamily predicted ATPase
MHNAKRHKIGNPFVYGETVTGENFADRVDELRDLERDLLDGQIVFMMSPRRFGKTSLILNLFHRLRQKGAITVVMDLYRCASLGQFLNQYLNLLLRAGETRMEKVTRFVGELLPNLRPRLSVGTDGSFSAELLISPIEKDLSKIAEEVFDFPQRIARHQKKNVVIAFDEFQEIRNFDGEQIEKTIRSVIQHHRQVGYMFAGSKRHVIKDMILRQDRAFYNAGKVINLGKIDRSIFIKFMQKKFGESDFKCSEEALEEICKVADDCPYYVQYLCHEIWDNFCSAKKAEKSDVKAVLERIVSEESPIYLTIWDELTLHQRRLLQAVATSGGKNIFSQEFVVRNELTSASSVQTSVNLLVDKGILGRENGSFAIDDVFFKYWILSYGIPLSKKIDIKGDK